ncbi:hypothetical protein IG631_18288 [Alternaria alternata]|nr:hypothetical protein IG631_18288 [Alternaria alternata]
MPEATILTFRIEPWLGRSRMFHAFTWSRQRRIRGIGHGSDGAPEVACRRSIRENEEQTCHCFVFACRNP